ncbi:MAG: hypothetical protein FWG63_08280 [Defluviitaleaceae bacterium]|nr:hypothetical protein [Defluviitaleaceae bacterium]
MINLINLFNIGAIKINSTMSDIVAINADRLSHLETMANIGRVSLAFLFTIVVFGIIFVTIKVMIKHSCMPGGVIYEEIERQTEKYYKNDEDEEEYYYGDLMWSKESSTVKLEDDSDIVVEESVEEENESEKLKK